MEEKRLFLDITEIDLRKDDLLYFVDVIKNRQYGKGGRKLTDEEQVIHVRTLAALKGLITSLDKVHSGRVVFDH